MITICMGIIFIVAYALGGQAAALVVCILNCFVPDDIPCVDEIIMLALTLAGWERYSTKYGRKRIVVSSLSFYYEGETCIRENLVTPA